MPTNRLRGILNLGDGRLVFIGRRENEKGWWHLGFRNSDGDDTRLLSHEAMAVLVQLYNKRPNGTDVFPLVLTTHWIVEEKVAED